MMQLKDNITQSKVETKIEIHEIINEKDEWEEKCKIEAMIVETLQEYLISLEQDYHGIVK